MSFIKKYCENCKKEVETKIVTIPETYCVKGKNVTINARVRICTECGVDMFDEKLDSATLEKVYEKAQNN